MYYSLIKKTDPQGLSLLFCLLKKDVIIIAQTAYALVGDRGKAMEAGCNDYISKPIKMNELKEMIKSHFLKSSSIEF